MADKKDKKSPEQQADERATKDLKSAHAQEFDQLKQQHVDKLKEKREGN